MTVKLSTCFLTLREWRCVIGVLITLISGCASPGVQKTVSQQEIAQRDQVLGSELSQRFETTLNFKSDTEISRFVGDIAQALIQSTPSLGGNLAVVRLLKDRGEKWQSYALPGNRIYLSASLLRRLDFENELAAIVAIQLGHILKNHILEKLEKLGLRGSLPEKPGLLENPNLIQNLRYEGPEGIFSFSEQEEIAAAQAAVGILYRSGYDARGVISVCELFLHHPAHSPLETDTITKMIEGVRKEVARFAPLRNPIVRSKKFLMMRKRIQSL